MALSPDRLTRVVSRRVGPDGARARAQLFAGGFALMRNAWRVLMAATLGLFVVSVPARYEQLEALAHATQRRPVMSEDHGLLTTASSPDVYPLLVVGLEISFVVALLVASAGIAVGRLDDWRNRFFSAVFFTYSVWVTPTLDALDGGPVLLHFVSLLQAVGLIFAIHFFLLFPDGRFVPRWTRLSSAFWIVYTLAWGIYPDAWFSLIDPFDVPFVVFASLMFGWVTGLAAQTIRYRYWATPEECKQVKWVVIAVASAVAGYGVVYLPGVFIPEAGVARVAFDLFSVSIFWLLAMPMALALGHRHVAVPVVRLPRSRQSNACIRIIDHHARARLLWPGHLAATGAAPDRRQVKFRDRRLHPHRIGSVQTGALSHPKRHRSALLPNPLRCSPGARQLLECDCETRSTSAPWKRNFLGSCTKPCNLRIASLLLMVPAEEDLPDQTAAAGRSLA